jgi:hypothetical protein
MKNALLVSFLLALSVAAVLVGTPFPSNRVQSQQVRIPDVPVPVRIEPVPTITTGPSVPDLRPPVTIDPVPRINTTAPRVEATVPRSATARAPARARVDTVVIAPGPGPRAVRDSPDCSVHQFTCAQACDPLPAGGSSYRQCLRYQCKQVDESCLEKLAQELGSRRTDNEVTFSIECDYPHKIQLEFYSQDRSTAWPGNNMAYNIDDYERHLYTLKCRSGDNICYGAWPNQASIHWGLGFDGFYHCEHCCAICDGRSVSFTLH